MSKLVLIDDDHAAHVYHALMAEEAGFSAEEITSYYSAEKALDEIKSIIDSGYAAKLPKFICLDVNLPILSGLDFIDAITPLLEVKNYPKIFLVSNSISQNQKELALKSKIVKGVKEKFLDVDFFLSLREAS